MEFSRYSTHSETIEQPEIEEVGWRFFAALCYTGLIEIDFKHDSRTGSYKLLDVKRARLGLESARASRRC